MAGFHLKMLNLSLNICKLDIFEPLIHLCKYGSNSRLLNFNIFESASLSLGLNLRFVENTRPDLSSFCGLLLCCNICRYLLLQYRPLQWIWSPSNLTHGPGSSVSDEIPSVKS